MAAASAAYLFNQWPEIEKLPGPEKYNRLCEVIHTAILAFIEFRTEIVPSEN